jgi:DNA polymerase elongation subunit (family B)
MNLITIDVEIYKNYFLLSALNSANGKVKHFEMYEGQPLNKPSLMKLMSDNTTLSFNGNSFDLPIIAAALSGWPVSKLKGLCDKIIQSNAPAWMICRDYKLKIPDRWDHIDIIEVAPGMASLKVYGGRLHYATIQDLPIEPSALISPAERATLRDYCVNDLQTTYALYKSLEKQVDLRVSMSEQYGVDLRSKSDAQIAETVIKSELQKQTGKQYRKPELPDGVTFKYQDPHIVEFQTEQLQKMFKTVLNIRFGLGANGAVKMPPELAKSKIKIGQAEYTMGIGGLHSCEKAQTVIAGKDEHLIDVDVASYYPNIILQQALAPKSMGAPFLKVYQSIVDRRIRAKHSGDKVTANTLKIVVNGSFGKLGSKWSALYAPELMLQTTITGQLALLMLIEAFELAGLRVYSANTDGVVVKCKADQVDTMRNICFDWMLSTSYELEETHYKALASRDVNNYIAVTTEGELKRKGVFASGGLAKNPDCNICFTAVGELLANGIPLSETIVNCKDVTQFVTVRKVTGGAKWRDEYLGKAVRFYYSKNVHLNVNIEYVKNGNKVPKSDGAKPLMTLPNTMPDDVDYKRYIAMAEELLRGVGYA